MEGSIGKNQTFIPLQTHTFQPLKYCLVIISYVFISLFSCLSCVLLYIYIALSGFFFFFGRSRRNILVSSVFYLRSRTHPSPNKLLYDILCHRLNMFQKSSPNVLGKMDTLNYWWTVLHIILNQFMTSICYVEWKGLSVIVPE